MSTNGAIKIHDIVEKHEDTESEYRIPEDFNIDNIIGMALDSQGLDNSYAEPVKELLTQLFVGMGNKDNSEDKELDRVVDRLLGTGEEE